jgi:hypothetical protein
VIRWFGAILAIGPVILVLAFWHSGMGCLYQRTIFLTNLAVILGRLTANDSFGMPQPRISRRRGPSEVPQAQVLSYPANREKGYNDECDCIQPW